MTEQLTLNHLAGSDSENLPVRQETQVQSLGQEDPLEKGMHSGILAWRIPCTANYLVGHSP